jgi:flagellar basal-body rod protein FlgB
MEMAINGLYERSKMTASNIANVATPGYNRQEIMFEDQLQKIREGYQLKEDVRVQNSHGRDWTHPKEAIRSQDPAQIAFLQHNPAEGYGPQLVRDYDSARSFDGNNVVIEEEMMNTAKTGTQFTTLVTLLGRSFKGLESVIKGQGQ